nr:MAG: ribose-phosphate pyrophosphokinase [Hyphomicrobiales bacterium]
MTALLVALPGNEAMAENIAKHVGGEIASLESRSFPDGESYFRYLSPLEGRSVALICTLDRPNKKFLPLAFAAATARELGASQIGLIAPYLAYMRQDQRFHAGEALTSTIFARTISPLFDWLITVDPHLHRRSSLSEIYDIPAHIVQASPLFASWITKNVEHPILIGPDEESAQWVGAIAGTCHAPHVILKKERKGDRDVAVSMPAIAGLESATPILIDDIISSGHTMRETIEHLKLAGARAPICMAVHGIFAENAYEILLQTGAVRIVTANTITHESNAIDVCRVISGALGKILG